MTKRRPKYTNFTDLCERRQKFCELVAKGYVDGRQKKLQKLTLEDCYITAGYERKYATQNAYTLYRDLHHFIKELRSKYVEHSQCPSLAMKVIEGIMTDEEIKPETRLKAAQDVLARTGFDKPKEHIVRNIEEMDEKEIEAELEELIGQSDNISKLIQQG